MALHRTLTIIAAAASAAVTGCAAPDGRPGRAPMLTQPQQDAVLETARAMLSSGSCPAAAATVADAPVRLEDPRHNGALWQPVRVEGCGRRGRLNMLVAPASGGGGAASVTPLLPGATAADPLLQREGLRLVLMAVKDSAPDCERVAVNDTRPDAAASGAPPEIGGGARRPWTENWILTACGRPFTVQVRFTPAAGGTEVVVDPPAAGRPRT